MPKSDEIVRYRPYVEEAHVQHLPASAGLWVTHHDHLADKTAALEAQAEEHREDMRQARRRWWNERAGEFTRLVDKHAAELAALRGEREAALIHYEHPHLIGEPCMIHRDFKPEMERLCNIAGRCDVEIWVTHSFRPLNAKLVGAIVEAAERSNHHAGSGVDMNPVYQGVWYTSEKMADWDNLPEPVKGFLRRVENDESLRWGGQFGVNKDRVHIDSDLARRDPAEWARRTRELQDA